MEIVFNIFDKMSVDEVELVDFDTREIWENLSEWDNLENPLAPLSVSQDQSILELTAFCVNKFTAPPVSIELNLYTHIDVTFD